MKFDPYAILERRIRTGEYRAGYWLATERQLSEEFGVHRGTIRRAISRLAGAGLVVCQPGRRPVVTYSEAPVGQPGTVALLIGNEPMYPAFQMVARGCEPVLRAEGYRLVFMDTWAPTLEASRKRETEAIASLVEHPVAGIILWCQSPRDAASELKRLQERAVPIIAIDREVPTLQTDFVGIDNVEAAMTAVDHLIAMGHRRIALATKDEKVTTVDGREAGYRESMARHNIAVDESLVYRFPDDATDATIPAKAEEVAKSSNPPTAIFAMNDILAWRFAHALRHAGMRIPEDISIVGFDDLESFAMSQTGLTTIHQPYETMGRQAARLVCRRLANPAVPLQHVLLETTLVQRASVQSNNTLPRTADVSEDGSLFLGHAVSKAFYARPEPRGPETGLSTLAALAAPVVEAPNPEPWPD